MIHTLETHMTAALIFDAIIPPKLLSYEKENY